jgi:hypothetical protein
MTMLRKHFWIVIRFSRDSYKSLVGVGLMAVQDLRVARDNYEAALSDAIIMGDTRNALTGR